MLSGEVFLESTVGLFSTYDTGIISYFLCLFPRWISRNNDVVSYGTVYDVDAYFQF